MFIDVAPRMAFTAEIEHENNIARLRQKFASLADQYQEKARRRPVFVNGREYESVMMASYETGFAQKSIRDACLGKLVNAVSRCGHDRRPKPITARWLES
jgi:hypothetical protein